MPVTRLLLDVDFAGTVLRVSDVDLDVYDTDEGEWLHYTAGLDSLTVDRAFDFLSTASASPRVPVECRLPMDVAAEEAALHRFALSPASLALWTEGDDYQARRVLASGRVLDPEWGEYGEPVSFSVGATAATTSALVIPLTHCVDETTWPDSMAALSEENVGVAYPRVYGSPGAISESEWVTGSQGVWILQDNLFWQLCIAGNQVVGDYVWLNVDANVPGLPFRVTHQRDARGALVAFVDAHADWPANTVTIAAGPYANYYGIGNVAAVDYQALQATPIPVFVSWRKSPVDLTTPAGLSPLAGDIILDLLQRAGVSVDYGRFAAAAALLRGYRFDCVIDDPEALAVAWLQENVYPLLPISMSPDGDYPVVWRYDATAEDATARLDADADPRISRAGKLKDDGANIANAFSIQYRYSVRTDAFTATVTRDASTCPYCAASEARYGRIEKALTTRNVYDEATAAAILGWMARAYTSPSRRVSYLVPAGYRLTEGEIVLLTDSRVHLSAQLCLVSAVQIDGTGVDGVELLIVPDHPRDR